MIIGVVRRMQKGVLLILFLGASLATGRFVLERTDQTDDVTITDKYCYLPCSLSYPVPFYGHAHAHRLFSVKWSHSIVTTREPSFIDIENTTYWHDTHDLAFSMSSPLCRSAGVDTERLQLDCSVSIRSCNSEFKDRYRGLYKCHVQYLWTGEVSVIDAELGRAPDPDQPGTSITNEAPLGCYPPTAMNITARVITQFNNSTKMVRVEWESSTKPNSLTYCDGSRRWSVRVFTFDAEHLHLHSDGKINEQDKVPSRLLGTPLVYKPTVPVRQTRHFDTLVEEEKYYIFEVQNRYERPGVGYKYKHYASNIHYFGDQRAPYFLTNGHTILTVNEGQNVDIMCPAEGNPTPDVRLIHNGRELGTVEPGHRIRGFTSADVGDYYCSASNVHVNPPHGKRRLTASRRITIELNSPTDTTEPCQPYNGGICRNFLHRDTRVYISAAPDDLETTINDNVGNIALTTSEHNKRVGSHQYTTAGVTAELVQQCSDFVRAIACNTVYPYCDASSTNSRPVKRQICRHSCDVLREEGACAFFLNPDLWADEQRHSLTTLKDQLLSNCDPRLRPAGESPECIYVSFETPIGDGPGDLWQRVSCLAGNGQDYSGLVDRTETGASCQSWYSQSPNTHSIVPVHYRWALYGARFSCRNPGGLGERPWCYTAVGGSRWEYCDIPRCERCVTYPEGFCSSVPGYSQRQVYLNTTNWVGDILLVIEGDMKRLYHQLDGDELSPGCQNALKLIICHGALPFCHEDGPVPLKSCADHCTLLTEISLLCPTNIITELRSTWNLNNRSPWLSPPSCELAPTNDQCMPSMHFSAPAASVDCFNETDHGHSYTGPVAETERGISCQDWSASNFTELRYPELKGAGNSCRNPGQWGTTPWCITSQGESQPCLVRSCTPASVDEKKAPTEYNGPVIGAVIMVPIAIILIGGIVIILVMVVRRYQKRAPIGLSPMQLRRSDHFPDIKYQENGKYNVITIAEPLPAKVAEAITSFKQVPKENIEYVKQLGQGFFGMVFKGKMKPQFDKQSEECFVAVKTLKEDSNAGIEAFVNEAKLMFGFNHQNIVKILGVSMTQTPYYLIFEYMDKGDLAKFLRENASSLQRRCMDPANRPRSRTESTLSDDPAMLNTEQLADICKQIAEGMNYLSKLNYVHRDLACRNCLVQSLPEDMTHTASRVLVKIGDFGLSHNLYSKDYYRVRGQAVLPIRWMSPEAIIYGKFSTAGDVWSFGVVMWEVFTFGLQPYYGQSNEEVMDNVRKGKLLSKPSDCSPRLYTIMTECWQRDDHTRPSFAEILGYLDACRLSTSSEEDSVSMYSGYSTDAFLEENSDPETEAVMDQ